MKAREILLVSLASCSLPLASCGGDGPAPSPFQVVQDLSEDPAGFTTAVDFTGEGLVLGPASFESDAGQLAQSTAVDAEDPTRLLVTWNERVTPSHQVRIVGQSGIPETFQPVTASDNAAPTFEISGATQGVGLGDDVIDIAFSGPNVTPESVGDGANWDLISSGITSSLEGSAFEFDESAQTLRITTDATANVHGEFELAASGLASVADVAVSSAPEAGTATGDDVAPTLVSATQNLTEDEFGRVIDFQFSEAMDPAFSGAPQNFSLGFPVFATGVSQPSEDTLRVTFEDPVVPGFATVFPLGLRDAHGNEFSSPGIDPAAGSTVPNAFSSNPELRTVENEGGDELVVRTVQALAPEFANVGAAWNLTVEGSPVVLADESFSYDLSARTLTATLPADFQNGLEFSVEPAALTDLLAPKLYDVDGEEFVGSFTGTVAGETQLPGVVLVLQNRTLDPSGSTFDFRFSEDLDAVTAETTGAVVSGNGPLVSTTVLQADKSLLRVILDGSGLPGAVNFDVSGFRDLAGNEMIFANDLQAISTDVTAPTLLAFEAIGVQGPDNDELVVTFSDNMFVDDVEAEFKWTIESPPGTPLLAGFAEATYDDATRTATFATGEGADQFQTGEDVRITFTDVRDLGGNSLTGVFEFEADVENEFPVIETAFVSSAPNNDQITVRLSEAIGDFDDSFTSYELVDDTSTVIGTPTLISRTADGRGVTLRFGQEITPGLHGLNVAGVTDLAGNSMFPVGDFKLEFEDSLPLAILSSFTGFESIEGESNDRFTVEFDRRPAVAEVTDLDNWSLFNQTSGEQLTMNGVMLTYDGDRLVTFDLNGSTDPNFQNTEAYRVEVAGLISVQGIPLTMTESFIATATGDNLIPEISGGGVRLDPQNVDAVLIELSEAIDFDQLMPGNCNLNGSPAVGVEQVGPRSVRARFSTDPSEADDVNIFMFDLAGNLSIASGLVQAADATGPLLAGGFSANSVSGFGGDHLLVSFNEPIVASDAITASAYELTFNGEVVSLSGGSLRYSSVGNQVRIDLPVGLEIPVGATVGLTVSGLRDHAGNVQATAATVQVPATGDTTAPALESAFVNRRVDASGRTVDVSFNEDVQASSVATVLAWSASGGQGVLSATRLGNRAVRLEFDSDLGASTTLTAIEVLDAAGNSLLGASIDPLD